jgi:hypothetical protein
VHNEAQRSYVKQEKSASFRMLYKPTFRWNLSEEGESMNPRIRSLKILIQAANSAIAVALCLALVVSGDTFAFATVMQPPQETTAADAKIPNDQLDSLVAPIALYPDPLLSQILVASTYPLEIVQLSQWMQKNSKMPQDKMVEAVKKQDWDPSIQALVVLPDLVKNLNDSIKWTSDLGNAFLAQQSDVMDAVQRMRAKAKGKGNLQSTEQQKVETKVIESKEYIVIEPTKTDVVYVPSYEPTVVYGAPAYPYPVYPYPPAGYYAAGAAVAFGVGMMVGAAWGGGYGWNSGWGGNNTININNNNNFVNNSNRQNFQGGNRGQASPKGNSNWQHNPQHRGGAPYGNKATANKYGGSARGDSMTSRQNSARQNQASQMGGGRQQNSVGDRSAGASGSRGGDRGASASTMGSSRGGGGDRGLSSGSSSRGGGTFGSGGSSRSSSMASSSRGSSSMSSRGGGGGGRSGGGGGGRRR